LKDIFDNLLFAPISQRRKSVIFSTAKEKLQNLAH